MSVYFIDSDGGPSRRFMRPEQFAKVSRPLGVHADERTPVRVEESGSQLNRVHDTNEKESER